MYEDEHNVATVESDPDAAGIPHPCPQWLVELVFALVLDIAQIQCSSNRVAGAHSPIGDTPSVRRDNTKRAMHRCTALCSSRFGPRTGCC
ncbi:MAG: hypothetical protein UZ13_02753, partial [Chloroflexi bacterium OLB13]